MALKHLVEFPDVFKSEIASINARRKEINKGRKESERRDLVVLEFEKKTTEDDAPEPSSKKKNTDPVAPPRPSEKTPIVGLALSGGGARSAAFCLGALQALEAAKAFPQIDYLSTVSGGGYIGCSLSSAMTENEGKFPFSSNLREDEPPSLQHVRNYSNYLFPNGGRDFLYNSAIYVRGLVANVILVLPFLLIFAALTIAAHPMIGSDPTEDTRLSVVEVLAVVAAAVFFCFYLWGMVRSLRPLRGAPDYPNKLTIIAGVLIVATLLAAFCVLQPIILEAMLDQAGDSFAAKLISWLKALIVFLAPIAGAVVFAANKLGEIAKNAVESETKGGKFAGYLAQGAIYIAALVMPLLIWLFYLQLSYWGLRYDLHADPLAPEWLIAAAKYIPSSDKVPLLVPLYSVAALVGFILGYLLAPNANSLHPLYRDRLGKAFLFKPRDTLPTPPDPRRQPELDPLPRKLSALSNVHAPYHLINTALNLQNSLVANKRGRNADFFIFSRNFVGSKTTRYVATEKVEAAVPELDLATAMSASGAAVSSNMGAQTIAPLAPTLALLNVRLGFWMRNPIRLTENFWRNPFADLYFLYEMFGRLNERRRSIYLTDGGHIENLGIYELLRRRCKVIIAVDAEADPNLAFSSFNKLVRHALIDLGIRIDLPWQPIANMSKNTSSDIDKKADTQKDEGPHVAVGEIRYPDNRRGVLVYIKSSLSGDENDYIFDYKRRYAAFPHETTLDQFFSEEQFEAYRALGFHATHGFFSRRDKFAHRDIDAFPSVRWELQVLDEMFPIAEGPDPNWPRKFDTFMQHLPAVPPSPKPGLSKGQ